MLVLGFAGSPIQLVPDGTLLFHLGLIVVMVLVLNATLLKPINRILQERERRTKGRLSDAQQTLLTADEKLAEYERRLREARGEGYALMERERAAVTREAQLEMTAVKDEIARSLAEQKRSLAAETEVAKSVLAAGASTLALEISRQILQRPV